MNRLHGVVDLLRQAFQRASLRDVVLLSVVIAIACAIALFAIQTNRRRVRNFLLAHDRQARALAVLATRLDNMAQQLAQLQLDQVKQREQAPASRTNLPSDMTGLREELESLRKEFR